MSDVRKKKMDRRLKILRIKERLFFEMFQKPFSKGDRILTYRFMEGLPEDYIIKGVRHVFECEMFEIKIWSSEFDELSEGQIMPLMEPLKGTQIQFIAERLEDGRTVLPMIGDTLIK